MGLSADSREETTPAAKLKDGLPLTLRAGEYVRLTIRHPDWRRRRLHLAQQQAAQCALARAYQVLQERAINYGTNTNPKQVTRSFPHCTLSRMLRFGAVSRRSRPSQVGLSVPSTSIVFRRAPSADARQMRSRAGRLPEEN